jgi:hypothetical protein
VNFVELSAALDAKRHMQGSMFGDRPLKINFGREGHSASGGGDPGSPPPGEPKPIVEPPPQEFPPPGF